MSAVDNVKLGIREGFSELFAGRYRAHRVVRGKDQQRRLADASELVASQGNVGASNTMAGQPTWTSAVVRSGRSIANHIAHNDPSELATKRRAFQSEPVDEVVDEGASSGDTTDQVAGGSGPASEAETDSVPVAVADYLEANHPGAAIEYAATTKDRSKSCSLMGPTWSSTTPEG